MMIHTPIFDAHFHIIDKKFPLVSNQGYLPELFSVDDYRHQTSEMPICGGAIVSGSFQAFDQSYLLSALKILGPGFVGVTQLAHTVSDRELQQLHGHGVRALRFNIRKGGSEGLDQLDAMARRVHDLLGWHVELLIDSSQLVDIFDILVALPAVSIDHLGLRRSGFKTLLKLVDRGVKVKASGFGRVDFDVTQGLKELYTANPKALMFGTDLPSTRAPRPFEYRDLELIVDSVGEAAMQAVFSGNALEFYKIRQSL